MGVGGQSPLPKDKLFHVGDGGIRQVRTQWRMVQLFENGWVLKGAFNRLVIETWTVDSE